MVFFLTGNNKKQGNPYKNQRKPFFMHFEGDQFTKKKKFVKAGEKPEDEHDETKLSQFASPLINNYL